MTSLHDLHEFGQSTWLNYLRNSFIRSGELASKLDSGIQGITANALVYQRAIAGGGDYDEAIRREMTAGTPLKRIHEALVVDDLQRAADVIRPIFESSNRLDGFVSVELEPGVLQDVTATVAEVRRLSHHIDRYNVMIEIPATPAGVEAIRELTSDGVSVNATHIFSIATYEKVAQAYIDGLEKYITSHSVWRVTPTAVASFSLSPIDDAIDALLQQAGRPDLMGKTAIALAKVLYNRFQSIFHGPRWDKLAARHGRVLRPKWTRTTPNNFLYPETYYIEALIGPETIATFSPLTLNAFRHNGQVAETITAGLEEAQTHLAEIAALGIDLERVTDRLQQEYLEASDRLFQKLIQTVMRRRDELDRDWMPLIAQLGTHEYMVDNGLSELCQNEIICRILAHDHTVWQPKPAEVTNRLGWLYVMDRMKANIDRLKRLANDLVEAGYTHALLLGMGGSSLAPELFQKTMGRPAQPPNLPFAGLDLVVLDTTDASAVQAVDASLDLTKTIVIVATKSGGTVETLSGFKYFYNRLADVVGAEEAGSHFIGITDPGSKIADLAQQYQFRDLFLNDPNIGGRYSALSYFGLVPAVLVSVNLDEMLERAASMAANAMLCDCDVIGNNVSAHLGTILGRMAAAGRDKLTIITSPALASFGDWAEQLIAESLGKEGKGILPVVGEPMGTPRDYGDDRLFVHLRLAGDRRQDASVAALSQAGLPVVTLHLQDIDDIGGQFFLWEMATALAAYFLGINPFDQPNVEAAKIKAREIVAEYTATGALPDGDIAPTDPVALKEFLGKLTPGDYIAIQAYARMTPELDAALLELRRKLQTLGFNRLGTLPATTVGYGPRFLHSTGQLHKGDRGNGLFLQLISEATEDVTIPDEAGKPGGVMTFNVLKKAQALGDARALRAARRQVISFDVGTDPVESISRLAATL